MLQSMDLVLTTANGECFQMFEVHLLLTCLYFLADAQANKQTKKKLRLFFLLNALFYKSNTHLIYLCVCNQSIYFCFIMGCK